MKFREERHAKTRVGVRFRRLCAFVLAFSMLFGSWTPAIAVAVQAPTAVEAQATETPAKSESETTKPAEEAAEAPVKAEPEAPVETEAAKPAETPAKTEAAKPAEEAAETPAKPEEQKAPAETQANELEISPEEVPEGVGAIKVPDPKIDKVEIGSKTVTGGGIIGSGQRKSKNYTTVINVTLTRKSGGSEQQTDTIAPTDKRTKWSVTFTTALEVGDKISVQTVVNGTPSKTVEMTVEPAMRDKYKDTLTMPTGEIWIEQTSSNQVNKDEQAEAQQMLKDANPEIAKDFDFEKTEFSIDGVDHAYYEVFYTDGSTSGKVEATGLKIHQVTEHSATPTIEKVQVADDKITVTLAREVPQGTKFYLVTNFTDGEERNFCQDGTCTTDKSTIREMPQGEVSVDGTTVTFPVTDKDLELEKLFGVVVKEPHKFRSCAKSEPVITVPDKVAVRDPHKLTDADKKAIDQAIREANTVNGKSKLPKDPITSDPAYIDFDKNGNVRIIPPSNIDGEWDDSYTKYTPKKNEDGTYKVKDETQVYKIPAKDLVKNIAPNPPSFAVDTAKGTVTVTPPAYKDPGDDTDLASYTLTYKDKSGAEQTVTATRDLTKTENPWSGPGVDPATGVITLNVDDIEVGGTLKAVAKDNGGLEGDENKLDSDPATKKLDPVIVSYVPGTGDDGTPASGEKAEEKVNTGGKFTVPNDGTGFTAPEYHKFANKWKDQNGKEYTPGTPIEHLKENLVLQPVWEREQVKVTYKPGEGTGNLTELPSNTELWGKGLDYKVHKPDGFKATDPDQEFDRWTVDVQDLAQADLSAPFKILQDVTFTAQWKDILVDVIYKSGDHGTVGEETEKVKRNKKDYPLKANSFSPASDEYEFIGWKVDNQGETLAPGAKIDVGTGKTLVAQWQLKNRTVSFIPGEGSGKMDDVTAKVNEEIKLPASTFKAPNENMEFSHWVIDGDTSGKTYKAGDPFTVTANTTFKAIWKKIQVNVSYNANGGSGEMTGATVDKGSKYTVLPNSFTAPDDTQEFKAWEVNGKEVPAGTEITVDKDTEIKAIWKKIPVKVSYDANGGKGTMEGKTVDKGSMYTVLPNGFEAPDDTQEFKTWNVNGTEVAPGTEIKIDKDTVIQAVWKKIPVEVSYDANGGSGEMAKETVDKGSEYTVLPNGFKAPDDTQEFKAWEVDGKEVAPGTKIKIDKATVIKAIWKKIPVKVSYDANGGSGTMTGATVDKGSEYTVLPNAFTAPENQEFKGWEVDGKVVAPNTTIKVMKDTVIKAVWKDTVVDVSYNPGEGSGSMKGESLKKGSTYTLLPNRFKAPDENMKFKGWLVGNETKQPGDKITVTENTVVTAVWENIEVKVSYDANGGSGDMTGKTLKRGSSYVLLENGFTAPAGKEFNGWRVGFKNLKPGDTITVNEDTVVRARWKVAPATVTFNHGDNGTGDMDPVKVKRGSNYRLPENKFSPNPNYKFKTWRIGNVEMKPGRLITINDDTEIVAVWTKMVNITYKANGGAWSNGDETKTQEVSENTPFSLDRGPKRDGYRFTGWLLEGTDGTPLRGGTQHKGTAEALVFVAQWKPKAPGKPGETPNVPPVTPDTPVEPDKKPEPPVTPGTEPGTPSTPLTPSESGIVDREALLRRMKELWSKRALEQVQVDRKAIPAAGVGASAPSSVETVLFPVDLLPAPKKREED